MKKIISLLIVMLISCGMVIVTPALEENVLYVSTQGSDDAVGTPEAPLKTLDGARKRVRELKENGISVSEVIFRGGDYYTRKVNFDEGDSGTKENPIVYRAYEGETVRFKGSVPLDISNATAVTDAQTLALLRDGAKSKVIVLDLAEQGLTANDMYDFSGVGTGFDSLTKTGGYNYLYIDDYICDIAQWPNGPQYAIFEATNSLNYFKYLDEEPNRWTTAKHAWIRAYASNDYSCIEATPITSIDTVNKYVYTDGNTGYSYKNPWSKRWKVYNLIEELDMPGEFYIDLDKMLLYIYPPYSIKDSKIEMAVENDAILKINKLSNVTFSGLEFTQSRYHGVDMRDTVNVDFVDCKFKNIEGIGLNATGSARIVTGDLHVLTNSYGSNDACYDMNIRGCVFDTIGSSAINAGGGNYDTLTPSGNIIEDNFITAANMRVINRQALQAYGVGGTVRNNIVTHSRKHALNVGGNNNVYERNEFYDVLRETADAGAVYQGNNQLQRGNIIRQNFLHTLEAADPSLIAGVVGIYMDDNQHGNTIEQNIIVGAEIGMNSNGGGAMNWIGNTVIDSPKPWNWHDAWGGDDPISTNTMFERENHSNTLELLRSEIMYPELYFKTYPILKEWVETGKNPKYFNVFSGNLSVGDGKGRIAAQDAKYATFSTTFGVDNDSLEIPSTDAFVDPDNKDYRLKSESELAKKMPRVLNDTFDIENIGLINDIELDASSSPFRLLYPHNGSTVSAKDLELYWQEAFGANAYKVIIATDPEFKNIVKEDTSKINIYKFTDTTPNTEYYWKVEAINSSRDLASQWENVGGIGNFVVGLYSALDKTNLNIAVEQANKTMSISNEGTEVGTFKFGTAERLRNYISKTMTLAGLRGGNYSQEKLNERVDYITNYYLDKSLFNSGYLNLVKVTNKDMWTGTVSGGDDSIENIGSKAYNYVGTKNFGMASGTIIYCFDAAFDLPGDQNTTTGMLSLGMNKFTNQVSYTAANKGYYLIIKNHLVELQRTTGSKNGVLAVKENYHLTDGNKHKMMYGVINTAGGCMILLVVDGEVIFEYYDVSADEQSAENMEFLTNTYKEDCYVKLYEAGQTPSQEEFTKLVKNAEYKTAQAAVEALNTETISFLKPGCGVVITQSGAVDVSYAKPELKDNTIMVPAKLITKLYGGSETLSDSGVVLDIDGNVMEFTENHDRFTFGGTSQKVAYKPYYKNGHLMIPLEDVAKVLKFEYMYDDMSEMAIFNNSSAIHNVNQSNELGRVSKCVSKLSEYGENIDISFENVSLFN